jgi:endonuclease YncB( thermonuclease family)
VSAEALRAHIGSAPVRCDVKNKDQYNRSVAVCYNGSEDLNSWMAANGYAVAYTEYSKDYVSQADAARKQQLVRFKYHLLQE